MGALTDMSSAIAATVDDGDGVYLAGFTHHIPFAAGHEIIRQGRTGLHLMRATPDLLYDQLIAAGCASALTFSYAGNPGVGSLRAFRRAVEDGVPNALELDEYSHFGLTTRLTAGAHDLPFLPLRSFTGSDLPAHNDNIRTVADPFGDDDLYAVAPLNPDVAVVRAQRADESGNAHLWGIAGELVEAAFAADRVVLCAEEIVPESVIRSDPDRTAITADVVDHVVHDPYGAHPSYAQGYYDRDNEAYLEWDEVSATHDDTLAWLDEWVHGVADRREYLGKLGADRLLDLQPGTAYATPVDMGRYA